MASKFAQELRRRWLIRLGIFGSLGLSACARDGDFADFCGARVSGTVYASSWWGGLESEATAKAQVEQQANECNGSDLTLQWRKSDNELATFTNKQEMDDALGTLLPLEKAAARSPVDAVILNGGTQLCKQKTELRLRKVTALHNGEQLYERRNELAVFSDVIRCDGEVYAVPIGVHQLNVVMLNRTRLCARYSDKEVNTANVPSPEICGTQAPRAGVPPHSQFLVASPFADFATFAQFVRQIPGGRAFKLLTKDSESWTLSQLVVENGMNTRDGVKIDAATAPNSANLAQVLTSGNYLYDDLQTAMTEAARSRDMEPLAALAPRLRAALIAQEAFLAAGEVDESLTAAALAKQVGTGDSLMFVTGDWSVATAKKVARDPSQGGVNDEIVAFPFPGSDERFVFGSDVMVFPAKPFHEDGGAMGAALAYVMTSAGYQQQLVESTDSTSILTAFDRNSMGGFPAIKPVQSMTHWVPVHAYDHLPKLIAQWVVSLRSGATSVETARENVVSCLVAAVKGPCPILADTVEHPN